MYKYEHIDNSMTGPVKRWMERHNELADVINEAVDEMVLSEIRRTKLSNKLYREIRADIWLEKSDGLGKSQIMASIGRLEKAGVIEKDGQGWRAIR